MLKQTPEDARAAAMTPGAGIEPNALGRRILLRAVLAAALIVTISAAIVAALYLAMSMQTERQQVASLAAQTRQLVAFADRIGPAGLANLLRQSQTARDPALRRLANETFAIVYNQNGTRLYGPKVLASFPARWAPDAKQITYSQPGKSEDRGAEALAVSATLTSGGSVTVARARASAEAFAQRLLGWFLAGVAALTALVLTGAVFVARAANRRLSALTDTIAEIMSGDMSRRLAIAGTGDEIDRLSGEVNVMLERIERLMRGLKDVSDSIAHDLRTPLNRMRARIEAALRDSGGQPADDQSARAALERTIEDADGLIRTFDSLLLVARLEAGAVARRAEPFSVPELLADVADLYEPVAEEQGMAISVMAVASDAETITAHRQLVSQAVTNLVENAIKYAGNGASAQITLSARRKGADIVITVADNGPGIPEALRARALQRFARLDTARSTSGAGLGLSLVAAVAELHGGRIELCDNDPGLRASLVFPAQTGA